MTFTNKNIYTIFKKLNKSNEKFNYFKKYHYKKKGF